MIVAGYNKSKKIKYNNLVEIQEIANVSEYIKLGFSAPSMIYPSNAIFPSWLKTTTTNDYLLMYYAKEDLGENAYYLTYEGVNYGFTCNIRKNDRLTLKQGENNALELYLNGEYQNKIFLKVHDTLTLNKNGNQTTFSEVICDFGKRKIEDLPFSLQEVTIYKIYGEDIEDYENGEILFYGYVDDVQTTQKYTENDEIDLKLSLLSPMNITTKKTISISENATDLATVLEKVFEPLIRDGFSLFMDNLFPEKISCKFFLETIETVVNKLANECNFYWYIDEYKNIYCVNMDYLTMKDPKKIITSETIEKSCYSLLPTIKNSDYFNSVSIKNARVFTTLKNTDLLPTMALKNGDRVEFKNPVEISVSSAKRVFDYQAEPPVLLEFKNSSNQIILSLKYNSLTKQIDISGDFAFSDDENQDKTFILERDSFFQNLITGITYKGTNLSLISAISETALEYRVAKINNTNEIEKCKELINQSGIVEKIVDVSEAWFTEKELINYAINLIKMNAKETTEIEMSFDDFVDYNVGDIIKFEMSNFFINGTFIITETNEIMRGIEYEKTVKLVNNIYLDNYIDIFRTPTTEEDESKYKNTSIIIYSKDAFVEEVEAIYR